MGELFVFAGATLVFVGLLFRLSRASARRREGGRSIHWRGLVSVALLGGAVSGILFHIAAQERVAVSDHGDTSVVEQQAG